MTGSDVTVYAPVVEDAFDFSAEELAIVETTRRAQIVCIIPAYNEAETIESVLEGLLAQTRLPDAVHVIINNSSDNSFDLAKKFAGEYSVERGDAIQNTAIYVHDMGKVPDKKVGALNYGFRLADGADFLLGVDGDTVMSPDALELMEAEITSDPRIGGISAIYTVDNHTRNPIASLLLTGQRAQFAAFNLQNLLRGRNMAVLGGQSSIFRISALHEVMAQYHQDTPWVSDSEVEDSLLSLQIKNLGYSTKISATARAVVGGMDNIRALDGQQVKWNYGAIDLMWPGQRGDTSGQPFHPNLRLRWIENIGMLVNIFTRISFLALLIGALSIDALVLSPIWLIPPIVATALNVRIAMSIQGRTWRDVLFAATLVPAEIYMWVRIGHFIRAWTKFLSKVRTDNWAAQARAERGAGWAHLTPLIVAVVGLAAIVYGWNALPVVAQASILWVGWPLLAILTALQTLFMLRQLTRRQYGYRA
ncbi:glycosyltransferase family 2 protein [Serinibacter arcticus]|nr:glycosyltransferase family 2 protein [Serinibacter arcticus]